MPIEIAEYIVDPETGAEEFRPLRVITAAERAIAYNTKDITGVDEMLVIQITGHIIRQNGEEIVLANPDKPRLVLPLNNILSLREVFFGGTSKRFLCIRHIKGLE